MARADPKGDWGSVLIAHDGEVIARGPDGERTIPADELFLLPYDTSLGENELITEARIPTPVEGEGSAYHKLKRKRGDYAMAGVAARLVLDSDGRIADTGIGMTAVDITTAREAEAHLEGERPSADLFGTAGELAARGRADVVDIDGGATLFVDGLAPPPPELVVFGTGHDVGPVTGLAIKNDFRVTVVGFRGAVDLAERFPDANRTLTTSPAAVADDLDLDADTYAVVMTHNFVDDRLTVEALLDSPAPYVGLMGPRERFDRMREEFEATFDDAELASLYTPVGLDLGGGSPYQIARSIVSEALAVSNGRPPQHLKTREGPIHDRVNVGTGAGVPPR
jgi:xanthine/CO dehydrogenase XdhC/CoxF family maturation factor